MEYKSDTRSEQFVESVIYINLTLSWDINLPSPLSNMLNGLFTSKRSSAEKRQGCSKHVRTCLSISDYLAGWWFGTSFIFPYIGNFSIPTEKIIYFRRVAQTSTSHCYNCLQLSRPRSPACRRQLAPWAWWAWCGSSCGRWSASRWSSFSLLGPRKWRIKSCGSLVKIWLIMFKYMESYGIIIYGIYMEVSIVMGLPQIAGWFMNGNSY